MDDKKKERKGSNKKTRRKGKHKKERGGGIATKKGKEGKEGSEKRGNEGSHLYVSSFSIEGTEGDSFPIVRRGVQWSTRLSCTR